MFRIIPKIGRIRDHQIGQLVPGVVIRDPVTMERLREEGILVDRVSAYWRRRERDGGVTVVDELALAKPSQSEQPAEQLATPAPPELPPLATVRGAPLVLPLPAAPAIAPTSPIKE